MGKSSCHSSTFKWLASLRPRSISYFGEVSLHLTFSLIRMGESRHSPVQRRRQLEIQAPSYHPDFTILGLAFDRRTCILLVMSYENRLPPDHPPLTELQSVLRAYFGYLPDGLISTSLDDDGNALATWETIEDRNNDEPI